MSYWTSPDSNVGFADRQFYADWWNSCDWLEFCKFWRVKCSVHIR